MDSLQAIFLLYFAGNIFSIHTCQITCLKSWEYRVTLHNIRATVSLKKIALKHSKKKNITLKLYVNKSIEASALELEKAWKQLIWYSYNLEKWLLQYIGLLVTRYAVLVGRSKRYQVGKLIEESSCGTELNQLLLPSSMDWYLEKSWKTKLAPDQKRLLSSTSEMNPNELQLQQLVEKIDKLSQDVNSQGKQTIVQNTLVYGRLNIN